MCIDTCWTGSGGACNLALPAGTPGSLPGNGPPWLTAVPVQGHDFTRPCCQLTFSEKMRLNEEDEEKAHRRSRERPRHAKMLHLSEDLSDALKTANPSRPNAALL